MANDYKHRAINKAIVEMYCSEPKNERYKSKYKDLIERSQPINKDWLELRDHHNQK